MKIFIPTLFAKVVVMFKAFSKSEIRRLMRRFRLGERPLTESVSGRKKDKDTKQKFFAGVLCH